MLSHQVLGCGQRYRLMTAFDSALPPRCVIAMCAAFHASPAFTQEKHAMQDESAIRGSVRTVHTVSEDGESFTPLTFAHRFFLLLALLLTHASFVCSQLHQAHTHTAMPINASNVCCRPGCTERVAEIWQGQTNPCCHRSSLQWCKPQSHPAA